MSIWWTDKSVEAASKKNIRYEDQETKLLDKPTSPRRLREGAAGILQVLNKKQHIAILGIRLTKRERNAGRVGNEMNVRRG